MKPLPKDLQTPKKSLDDFCEVTKRVLGHLPDIVSERATARNYIILSSVMAGTSKFARPINNDLFIFDNQVFDNQYKKFLSIIKKLKGKKPITQEEYKNIDSVVYTIQQSMGVGMDFLTELEGVYFVDPPPITKGAPYNQHISPFSKFIAEDIWNLLSS
jgi:hypothetical protein